MRIRNTLNPYSPGVLAFTFAWLWLCAYAIVRAYERPVRSWREEHPEGDHGEA